MANKLTKARKRRAERAGRWAESVAIWMLRAKGYGIKARRYRSKLGEIDLIAVRGKTLVFVEVKFRKKGASPDDLSPFQSDRLVRAASLYLAKHPLALDAETRFDLILLGQNRWPRHIKGAFGDDGWGGYSNV